MSARGRVGRIRGGASTPRSDTLASLPAPTEEPAELAAVVAFSRGAQERVATEADRGAVEGHVEVSGPPREVLIRTVPLSLKRFLA